MYAVQENHSMKILIETTIVGKITLVSLLLTIFCGVFYQKKTTFLTKLDSGQFFMMDKYLYLVS